MSRTLAIVLHMQPYNDKAHILHAYTREGGRTNYMVYGIGRKKAAATYTPLSIVEITSGTLSRSGQGMPVVKEAHLAYIPAQLQTDMRRRTVALFIAEVLYRTLRHPMEDPDLFDYIASTAKTLDTAEAPENLHLAFLVGLAERIGFAIDAETHPDLLCMPSTRTERQHQLRALCTYYEQHIDDWQTPRSLDILTAVFD